MVSINLNQNLKICIECPIPIYKSLTSRPDQVNQQHLEVEFSQTMGRNVWVVVQTV